MYDMKLIRPREFADSFRPFLPIYVIKLLFLFLLTKSASMFSLRRWMHFHMRLCQNLCSCLPSEKTLKGKLPLEINAFLLEELPVAITKTYLYNVDPLKPHFYIVKLGFTGVYIIILISAQNIDCGYSLEPPRLTSTHNLCFEQKYEKNIRICIWKLSVLMVKFLIYLNRCVFVMVHFDRSW